MLYVSLTIEQVNYSSLLMMTETDKSGSLKTLLKSFLKGGVLLFPQKVKDALAVKYINYNPTVVMDTLNDILETYSIHAQIVSIRAEKTDYGLVVNLELNPDLKRIADWIYSKLTGLISTYNNTELIREVIGLIGDEGGEIAAEIFDILQKFGKLERLTVLLVTYYRKKICEYLTEMISENGVSLQITDLFINT